MTGPLLAVEPAEYLTFVATTGMVRPQTLWLTNQQDSAVFFKVKTTAPKKYCVRPNSGKVDPGTTVNVQISLQSPKEDDINTIPRDKFLVQSIVGKRGDEPDTLFKETAKDAIGETKLRCRLDQEGHEQAAEMTMAHTEDVSPPTAPAAQSSTLRSAAEEEGELAKVLKLNQQLKEHNKKLHEELQQAKNAGLRYRGVVTKDSNSSGAMATGTAHRQDTMWPLFIVAALVGWLLGHFLL